MNPIYDEGNYIKDDVAKYYMVGLFILMNERHGKVSLKERKENENI